MKKHCKKLIVFSLFITIFLSLTGCSLFSKNKSADQKAKQNAQEQQAPKIDQDVKKTEQLKKEKEIFDGQVYIQDNTAIATMVIKDGVSEADAKALAEKYAKQLKEQHKDLKVNVQAVQKGKNIANITIEK